MKFLSILFLLSLAFVAFSAQPVVLKRSDVAIALDKWKELIDTDGKERGTPVTSSVYDSFASRVGAWLANPDLELTTETPKSWFIKLKNNFTSMAVLKRYVEHARLDGKAASKVVIAKKEKFLVAYDKFIYLKSHVPRFNRKKINELKRRQKLRLQAGQKTKQPKREPRIRRNKILDNNMCN